MKKALSLYKAWEKFWFEAHGERELVSFRFCFGLLLFAYYLLRSFDLELFYLPSGLSLVVPGHDADVMLYRYSFLNLFLHTVAARPLLWLSHVVFLGSLLSLAISRHRRISAVVASVLHISFLHQNMGVLYGVDMISTFFLLYLCLPSSLAYRLSQVQVCVIYAYSGFEKLRGSHWWGGEAIWDVLANAQLARWDFSWLSSFPLPIVGATYATLLWEIYFPALIWSKKLRHPYLLFGVALHVGIGMTINIPFFGALMVTTYLLFADPGKIESLVSALGSRLKSLRGAFRRKVLFSTK